MYKPTHGHVYIEGRDYSGDESAMDPIGYCPQENILMNYLTTMEHLYIFGMVKKNDRFGQYINFFHIIMFSI